MTPQNRSQQETHYYLESKKGVKKLNDKVIKMEETNEAYGRWMALADVLASIVGLLGVILSETKETKTTAKNIENGNSKKSTAMTIMTFVTHEIIPPVLAAIIIASILK